MQWIFRQNSSNNLGNKQQDDTKIVKMFFRVDQDSVDEHSQLSPWRQPTTRVGQSLPLYHQNGGGLWNRLNLYDFDYVIVIYGSNIRTIMMVSHKYVFTIFQLYQKIITTMYNHSHVTSNSLQ
jgi:hypothetical protein